MKGLPGTDPLFEGCTLVFAAVELCHPSLGIQVRDEDRSLAPLSVVHQILEHVLLLCPRKRCFRRLLRLLRRAVETDGG